MLFFPHCASISGQSANVWTCDVPCSTCCNSCCKYLCTELLSFQCTEQLTWWCTPNKCVFLPTLLLWKGGVYIKQTKLENQSAQKVILQVSEMYTYSYFGQSFYFAVKDGTKIQSGLCNCHVLFPAEASFELWSISGVLGLGCRKPCASWPAKQPAGSRWVRNQVHAFFSTWICSSLSSNISLLCVSL